MKKFLNSIKKKFASDDDLVELEEDYVELDTTPKDKQKAQVIVRTFILEDFSDVKPIIDAIREGYTIAFVDMKILKDKDIIELKRAINKMKKTCEAVQGEIAGVGDAHLVVVPKFAKIYRSPVEK